MSRKEKIALSVTIALVVGVLWDLFDGSSWQEPELDALRFGLSVERGQSTSARELSESVHSPHNRFPPPLYIFEWVEYEVDISNASGGVLEINFTRDGKVLRTELVYGSEKIVLAGYGEYRFHDSNADITLRAIDANVTIGSLYVSITHGAKTYFSLLGILVLPLSVALLAVLLTRPKKSQAA